MADLGVVQEHGDLVRRHGLGHEGQPTLEDGLDDIGTGVGQALGDVLQGFAEAVDDMPDPGTEVGPVGAGTQGPGDDPGDDDDGRGVDHRSGHQIGAPEAFDPTDQDHQGDGHDVDAHPHAPVADDADEGHPHQYGRDEGADAVGRTQLHQRQRRQGQAHHHKPRFGQVPDIGASLGDHHEQGM